MSIDVLTIKEVAFILKLNRKTIERFRTRKFNPLPMFNISLSSKKPTWRIKKSDLLAWMESIPDPRTDI